VPGSAKQSRPRCRTRLQQGQRGRLGEPARVYLLRLAGCALSHRGRASSGARPVGCAAYTWDIRGALSSGPELHRISCSTDMREREWCSAASNDWKRPASAHRPTLPAGRLCLRNLHRRSHWRRCAGGMQRVEATWNSGDPVLAEGFPAQAGWLQRRCGALLTLIGTGDTRR